MKLATVAANLVGLALLAVSGVATLGVVGLVGVSLLDGLTGARFAALWFTAGLALTAGFCGYVLRKFAAGNVIPLDYDISVAFRGGQGGL